MRLSDFDYTYPEDLVAIHPASPRSSSRLFCVDRQTGEKQHRIFYELPTLLGPEDVLVFNKSRVIPARFFVKKESGARREALFFEFRSKNIALIWIQGKVKPGTRLFLGDGVSAVVLKKEGRDVFIELDAEKFWEFLQSSAVPALPPYLRKQRLALGEPETQEPDWVNYQSVWAQETDFYSVAAPTASLHFDENLLKALKEKGLKFEYLFLHVGAGTFLPLEEDDLKKNKLHFERVEISAEVWKNLKKAKREGRRIVGVGSTVARALESAAIREKKAENINLFSTDIFIYPGFKFQMIDSLITNFHQPRTSLLALVQAFLGERLCWRDLYEEAIREKYRLFSYGDAMWIR